MGEIAIPVDKWFPDGQAHLWHDNLPVNAPSISPYSAHLSHT